MNKKNAENLCKHLNAKNNGFHYFVVKSGECADCWDVAKEAISAEKPTKNGKNKDKNADSEANNGVAE